MTKIVICSVPFLEVVPPVAPALLSSCLNEAGIPSVGIDFNIDYVTNFIDKPYWNSWKLFLCTGYVDTSINYKRILIDNLKFLRNFCSKIQTEHQPSHIGLSVFSAESLNFSYLFIYAIRKFLPDVKIIIGGRGIESECPIEKIVHYEKYHKHGLADLIFVGDAETDLVHCIKNNVLGIYKARQQSNQDLDAVPAPIWDYYNFDLYENLQNNQVVADHTRKFLNPRSMVVTASKGCVRQCNFCDVKHFWPNYIYRDGANVARDIIQTYQSSGITEYEFTDNLINGSITNFRKMNKILAETIPYKIKYGGYAIFRDKRSSTEEDFVLAARAGCDRWSIGVESGNEAVRKDMGKNFTNEDMDHSITNLYKNKIRQHWLMMVGYPSETDEAFEDTLSLFKKYKQLNHDRMIEVSISLPFQLMNYVPLTQDEKYLSKYQWNNDGSIGNLYRFFWTTTENPENTFERRYQRWVKLTRLIEDSGYKYMWTHDSKKLKDELDNLKKIYDEKHKKVIIISSSK